MSASTAQPRGSGTSETKWEFVVEPGGKQVHLGLVPPGAYCLEDRWKEDHLLIYTILLQYKK